MEYIVNLQWDEEVGVWIATSEDIPGLVLESGSIDALIERVRYAVPELMKLNHQAGVQILNFQLNRRESVFA